jgi:hypothetical protein
MISKKLRQLIMSAMTVVTVITLSSFVNDAEDGSSYCKNDPNRNTGVCGQYPDGHFECEKVSDVIMNKNCYGVGSN